MREKQRFVERKKDKYKDIEMQIDKFIDRQPDIQIDKQIVENIDRARRQKDIQIYREKSNIGEVGDMVGLKSNYVKYLFP